MLMLPANKENLRASVITVFSGLIFTVKSVSLLPDGGIRLLDADGCHWDFKDYDLHDRAVIADPLILYNLVKEAIKELTRPCKPVGTLKEDYIKAIKGYVGPGGNIPFENGFQGPKINPKWQVTEVSDKTVTLQSDREQVKLTFEQLSKKALADIVKAINKYAEYCRKSA